MSTPPLPELESDKVMVNGVAFSVEDDNGGVLSDERNVELNRLIEEALVSVCLLVVILPRFCPHMSCFGGICYCLTAKTFFETGEIAVFAQVHKYSHRVCSTHCTYVRCSVDTIWRLLRAVTSFQRLWMYALYSELCVIFCRMQGSTTPCVCVFVFRVSTLLRVHHLPSRTQRVHHRHHQQLRREEDKKWMTPLNLPQLFIINTARLALKKVANLTLHPRRPVTLPTPQL